MSATATKLITAAEFMAMPEPADGSRQELVRGEVVLMPRPQQEHGIIQVQIAWLLKNVVSPNRLGWVGVESGILTEQDPDTVRGPDVYFFSIEQMPNRPTGYPSVAPALAVEVLSPSDRRGAMRDKVREYLAAGVRLVWVVDPETRTVMVYAGNLRGTELDDQETITGGDVLPAFTCSVADFFQ